jgi:hypothetical protein
LDLTDPTQIIAIGLPFGAGLWSAIALDAMAERIARRMIRRHMRIAAGDPTSGADLERPPTSTRLEPTQGARGRDPRLETEAHSGQEVHECSTTSQSEP